MAMLLNIMPTWRNEAFELDDFLGDQARFLSDGSLVTSYSYLCWPHWRIPSKLLMVQNQKSFKEGDCPWLERCAHTYERISGVF